jgi:uncharacterized protein
MYVSIVCTALLGLLLFGLGLFVSIQRQRHRIIIGHDPDPLDAIHRAVRAHANTAEYAPFLAIMFLWHGVHDASAWILGTLARFVGALGTYICGLLLAAAMLRHALTTA